MRPHIIVRYFLYSAIIVGALGITIVMVTMKPAPPKKEFDTRDPLVEVVSLEPLTTQFEVRSQGTVRPRTETVLSAEVSGTVTGISSSFVAGGVFDAGEVLLRIDPTNYTVAVAQAQALVKQRQIEFDGATKLRSQGYRAESELAAAEAALASAQAELVRGQRDLERSSIRLPYAGLVRAKEADIGHFVNPGTRLGVVFATDYAEVRLPLTDLDLAFVNLPDASEITSTGGADGPLVTLTAIQRGIERQWQAQIVRSEGVVDENSRVTYAVARVIDPYQLKGDGISLPMGTFVSASIGGNEVEGVFRVPRQVVRGSNELLFVDDENRIQIRSVDVIRSDADYAYVRGGIQAGERIVMTALETPFNGMAVRTESDEGSDDTEQLASAEEDGEG